MSVFDRRRRLAGSWAVLRATSTQRPPAVTVIRSPPTTWRREKTLPLDIDDRKQKIDECGLACLRTTVNVGRKVTAPYSLVDKELWWKLQHEGGSTGPTLAVETLEKKKTQPLGLTPSSYFPISSSCC